MLKGNLFQLEDGSIRASILCWTVGVRGLLDSQVTLSSRAKKF